MEQGDLGGDLGQAQFFFRRDRSFFHDALLDMR